MRLWRLSVSRFADIFDGGYGLQFEGRWNRIGRPVTYCATSPSLCVLEKLVHVEDPDLLPPLTMVTYEAPEGIAFERWTIADLGPDWRKREAMTQQLGDDWLAARNAACLAVPSAIVPIADSPDENVLINHSHPAARQITIVKSEPFTLDVRLL